MITKELLTAKREEVMKSRAIYQAQIAACDGALRILDDLSTVLEPHADEDGSTPALRS